MENKKTNLRKTIVKGISLGILGSGIAVSAVGAKIGVEFYRMNKWLEKAEETPAVMAEKYPVDRSMIFVPMYETAKTERTNFLVTDGLGTCCGLIVDDRKRGFHSLSHYSAMCFPGKIKKDIQGNFQNLEDLEFTVIAGELEGYWALRNIYKALKSLDALDRTKYARNARILVKEGRLYEPVF